MQKILAVCGGWTEHVCLGSWIRNHQAHCRQLPKGETGLPKTSGPAYSTRACYEWARESLYDLVEYSEPHHTA